MRFRFSFVYYAHNAKYLCNMAAIREKSVGDHTPPFFTDFLSLSLCPPLELRPSS